MVILVKYFLPRPAYRSLKPNALLAQALSACPIGSSLPHFRALNFVNYHYHPAMSHNRISVHLYHALLSLLSLLTTRSEFEP
jgi:hypothetical protein